MKRFVLALVATFVIASSALASDNCDARKFKTATGCQDDRGVWSATFENKVFNGYYNYCKQYPKTQFAVLTAGAEGQVVVVNKDNCTKTTYKADSSGIDTMKVVGGFVYFSSNDGQLYIVDARGNIFEIKSRSGNSYSRRNNSAVTQIKGDAKNQKILHVSLSNGQTFDLTAGEIISGEHKYELLAVTQGW